MNDSMRRAHDAGTLAITGEIVHGQGAGVLGGIGLAQVLQGIRRHGELMVASQIRQAVLIADV